ncbi:ABC transporter substrate-binding protein [Mycoplasma sp. P36-A1]|uniref:ABC transporter substrate-binding protein n=1 Tax=Mycoplasma sp. P36-A1 TaxID=3252900 RepID=UPI003C2FEF5F
MKNIKKILVLALLLVVSVGCSNNNKALDKIVATYVSAPLNVPSIIEKDGKYLEKALKEKDIAFDYSNLTTGPEQTQALASGDVQILNCVGSTSVILSAANGADIKILDMYGRSSEAYTIFSHDKSIKSAKDLKGKKIAGPQGTVLHELLVAYLKSADLTLDDVEFVNMTIPDAMAALSNKSVDASLVAGAAAYNAEKSGLNLVTTGKGYINATLVVAVTQEFYDNNKEAVEIFRNTQKEILKYMDENHDATIKKVAKELDLDEAAVKTMYKQYDFSTEVTDQDKKDMQKTADFMLENKMIEKEVNVEDLFIK